ncbi:GTPase HflX [bacterium]|nr:GTPase HflX [candidate division CSSED10-310 bacterium]
MKSGTMAGRVSEINNNLTEKALVIGIRGSRQSQSEAEQSTHELASLVEAAGADVIDSMICPVQQIQVRSYIGSGKVEEIGNLRKAHDVNLIAIDVALSPPQQRNLERDWNCKVIDRTGIILDIFARRAATREGQLQVELAQLKYRLPRLTRMWEHLSRLGAGIGTRGPGETQLEVDRRRIRSRLDKLECDLVKIKKRRKIQRENRRRSGVLSVALVGYTNAGKSSLLNRLTGSDVAVRDQLFVTLDPTIRQLVLPNQQTITVSDTVGFISRLPHELVAAFHATLEEVIEADLLLHVIDSATPDREEQILDVEKVLKELGVEATPIIRIYNKVDLQPDWSPGQSPGPADTVSVSTVNGYGIDELLGKLVQFQSQMSARATLFIPYKDTGIIASIRDRCEIFSETFEAEGTRLQVLAKSALLSKYNMYVVVEPELQSFTKGDAGE